MRIVRYLKRSGSKPAWGWVSEDRVGRLDSSPFGPYGRKEAKDPLERVRLLPPVEPGKIICIGRNYAAHAAEHDAQVPEQPLIFLKPPSSVIGPGEPILLPPQSENVEHEAELALVIGRAGRWIPPEKAAEHILGYTAANDVTARDLQRIDGQWTRGKGFDTFCPIGPWIETDLDPADVLLTCYVSGQMRQMGSTRDMVFPVFTLVTLISSVMTLNPGDVILTGTPAGVGPLHDGDEVTVEVEGIGELTNPVRLEKRRGE
ncbi:MAG: fumarylacetoacetate hydrolase family protein [Anaerolineales bacterium]|jgi:2-keto-4-pentenoate hydratase/2-oxohepta-3-ene-1,7-dioic acid hydratase in catechol pathway